MLGYDEYGRPFEMYDTWSGTHYKKWEVYLGQDAVCSLCGSKALFFAEYSMGDTLYHCNECQRKFLEIRKKNAKPRRA